MCEPNQIVRQNNVNGLSVLIKSEFTTALATKSWRSLFMQILSAYVNEPNYELAAHQF